MPWPVAAGGGLATALTMASTKARRSRHVLTSMRLNTEYTFQFGLDRHKRIDTDPLFPRELFNKLFLSTHT